VIAEKVIQQCTADGGLIHDIKLHVDQTGKYTFLGGLNLNFNVGEGFSVGTSSGWSASLDLTDAVGMMGKMAAFVLKPINFKYGTGIGESEGTNVSESTYLVSQIAGFDVELTGYERCAAIRLSDQAVQNLNSTWGDSRWMRAIGLSTADFSDVRVIQAFKRGAFVCEGGSRLKNPTVTVPEEYFYFTQHFTEGDMLDQADLYNHPWLFSLRGMRDFAMFVSRIRAQEIADLPEFLYHLTGTREPRMKGWALDHMRQAYQTVMPTFPGFYTLLDDGEPQIDSFSLDQVPRKLSKLDLDPLHELTHPRLMKENADTARPPELPAAEAAPEAAPWGTN
jgi:hypothetical protein